MFVVTVIFQVSPSHVEEFRRHMKNQAANSLAAEPGCVQFDVCFTADDPTRCFLYEVYESEAAFQKHLKSDHFLSFDQAVRDWIVSREVETWLRDSESRFG